MIQGKVIGRVWASKKLDEVPVGAILEVMVSGSETTLLAYDSLGCGEGETVIVTTGSVASGWFTGKKAPIDALIIAVVDEIDTPAAKPDKAKKDRK